MTLQYHHERTDTALDFDQYLMMPHFSNSKISEIDRGYEIKQTEKMHRGKEVDMILANGHPGTGLSKEAIRIAKKIESSVAWSVVKDSIKQPSLFGKFVLHTEDTTGGFCHICGDERTIVRGSAHCPNDQCAEYMVEYKAQPVRTPAFEMSFKTRPDFLCRRCTVDLKVTEVKLKHIPDLISQMKYERQMWIHRTMAQVPNSFLMIHSVPEGKTVLVPVATDYEDEIINFLIINGSGL